MSNVISHLFEIIINLYEGFLYVGFCMMAFPAKRKNPWGYVAFSIIVGCAYTLYMFVDFPLVDAWIMIIPVIYTLLFREGKTLEKIFWGIILACMSIGIVNVCYAFYFWVFGAEIKNLLGDGLTRIPYVIFTNLMITGGVFWLVFQKRKSLFEVKSLGLLVIVNLATLGIIELLYYQYSAGLFAEALLLEISVLAFLISIVSILLYRIISSYVQEEKERQRVLLLEKNAQEKLDEIKKHYATLKEIRHDLKNHIDVINELYTNGKVDEGEEYIRQLRNNIVRTFHSGNDSFDALLSSKLSDIEKAGISLIYEINDLSEIPIKEVALCAIVGNLLDNAVESLIRQKNDVPDQHIELIIRRSRNLLQIKCTNPVYENLIKKDGDGFISSKSEKGHGLGIPSIRKIVAENKGEALFIVKNGEFTADLWIPYSNNDRGSK